ncbi:MAG: co-chaperone GroES [Candidatus Vogelbacteria bacterium]|nr:co-chaperone GroES [Candidatus Vogelbacteria bacterium]
MKNTIKIKPLGDKVLVAPSKEDSKTKSGLYIPETASKERPEQGLVIAVGEGKVADDGRLVPIKVKKGQTVLFSKYGPDEVKVGDQEYLIISESNILAIIE